MTNYWVLLGILIVVAGFALRLNPMLVVTAGTGQPDAGHGQP